MSRSGYYNLKLTEDRTANIQAIATLSCHGYYNLKLTEDCIALIRAIGGKIGLNTTDQTGEIPGNTIGKIIDFALQTARFNRQTIQGSNIGEVIDFALKSTLN